MVDDADAPVPADPSAGPRRSAAPAPVPELADGSGGGGTTGPDGAADADGGPTEIDAVESVLDEVEQALARLDDGSYGRCRSCGTVIADDRLQEQPTAHSCADCTQPAAV
jgi:hypothetical protein